ncbi:MAG: hypothetical protein ABEJ27_02915 [Halodesulfurarchaeum sp.]
MTSQMTEDGAVEPTGQGGIGVQVSPSPSRRAEGLRLSLALLYLLGGVVHLWLGWRAPGIYERFAAQALVPAYAEAWEALVVPNLDVLQPLVAIAEVGIGLSLLGRGRWVTAGHAAGGLLQLVLVLSGPWGAINAGLAVLHGLGIRETHRKRISVLRCV